MQEKGFYDKFWTNFRRLPESHIRLHARAKFYDRNYLDLGYENGIAYYYTFSKTKKQWTVGLYIGYADKSNVKKTFDILQRFETQIKSNFTPGVLEWTKDDKDRCKIIYTKHIDFWSNDENSWKKIQLEMIKTMIQFEKSVSPFLANLP